MVGMLLSPFALAQSDISDTKVDVRLPAQLLITEEVSVSIDVTKGDGLPWDGELPEVSFTPADGVEDDVVFDCVNVDESESCQANNRGVAGVYESVFTLKKSPVTMTVEVDGVSKEVQLIATDSEQPVVEEAHPAAPAPGKPILSPASIQVGPSPSVWVILIPLAVMGIVVTMFVMSTTK